MKTIEYKAVYGGTLVRGFRDYVAPDASEEIIRVRARDINSGFAKALKIAQQPLGNGARRALVSIEFSQVP